MVFRIIFIILFVGSILARLLYAPEGRTGVQRIARSEGKIVMASWVIVGILIVSAGISYLFSLQVFPWAALHLADWVRWLAATTGFIGLVLLFWSHRTLGKQWSIALEIRDDHSLTTTGPYAYVRHPMYTSALIHYIGMAAVASDAMLLLLFVPIVVLVFSRIDAEEEMLIEEFGDEYRLYIQRTGRLLPRRGK